MQMEFEFMPKVFRGIEVRAPCRPFEFTNVTLANHAFIVILEQV